MFFTFLLGSFTAVLPFVVAVVCFFLVLDEPEDSGPFFIIAVVFLAIANRFASDVYIATYSWLPMIFWL